MKVEGLLFHLLRHTISGINFPKYLFSGLLYANLCYGAISGVALRNFLGAYCRHSEL